MHRYFLIPMIGFFIIICCLVIYLQFINEDWKFLVPKTPIPEICDDMSEVKLITHDNDYLEQREFRDKKGRIYNFFFGLFELESRLFRFSHAQIYQQV